MPPQPPLLTAIRWPNNSGSSTYSAAHTPVTAPDSSTLLRLQHRADAYNYAKPPSRMMRPNMRNRVRAIHLEHGPTDYNRSLLPSLRVDAEVAEDFINNFHVPPLPPTYWRVAYLLNRRHMFMRAAALAPDYTPTDRAALRANIDLWHVERLRRAITDLLHNFDWEDDPEPESPTAMLNAWMQTQSLGRQSHLRFSSDPGLRRKFTPRGLPDQTRAAKQNQLVQHAHALPLDQRRAYLQANPGTAWLYAQAYPTPT